MTSVPRFLMVVLLLLAVAGFLHLRSGAENLPPHESLDKLPKILGSWVGTDVAIGADVREVLGSGDFLLRVYENSKAQPGVNLFVAYIPTQQAGDTLHSPQNCLPGAGWSPLESGTTVISLPGHSAFKAKRYIVEKNGDRQLIFYWYSAHGRAVASEYWAKFYLFVDSIRLNRSDGSLVRVITPMTSGEPVSVAEQRLLDFSANAVPILDQYISR
jgi:EpsI family protein